MGVCLSEDFHGDMVRKKTSSGKSSNNFVQKQIKIAKTLKYDNNIHYLDQHHNS